MKRLKYCFPFLLFAPRLLFADGLAPIGAFPAKAGNVTVTSSLVASNALLGSTIVTNGLTVTNALTLWSGDLTASNGVTWLKQVVVNGNSAVVMPLQVNCQTPNDPSASLVGHCIQLYNGNHNHDLGVGSGKTWVNADGTTEFWLVRDGSGIYAKKFVLDVFSGWFQVNGASGLVTVLDTNAVFYGSFNGSGGNLTNFVNAVFAKTGNYTVTTAESGAVYDNNGAGGAVTNTLPAATVGLNYSLDVVAAQNFAFKANGTDTIRNAASVSAAGGLAFSSTIGTQIGIRCDVAGKWVLYMAIGTITIQ